MVETQFTHLKVKKPDEKDLPVIQPKVEDQNATKIEPVKQVQKPKENELNRKQRKTQEYIKKVEQLKREGTQTAQANVTNNEEEKKEDAATSTGEPAESSSEEDQDEVLGLSAEHRLKTLSGKARQRFLRKLKEQEEKELAEKERLKKIFEEREAEKARKLQEEADQRRKEAEEKRRI